MTISQFSATIGGMSKVGQIGLGNRCSVQLSYRSDGSFPRFLRGCGQRETRKTRAAERFETAQRTAQFVQESFS